jgi:hypothetical protein
VLTGPNGDSLFFLSRQSVSDGGSEKMRVDRGTGHSSQGFDSIKEGTQK